ncbi:hypothetical protein RI129_002564 [Pyrocoelia pectoralis]|uniref:Uncharacterized protein n=1 Tax=Pyrocoelia pectoralis TaxID=417401 RepID=A0AAN7ZLI8_9COLE
MSVVCNITILFLFVYTMWKYLTGAVLTSSLLYVLKKYFAGGVCRCTRLLDRQVVIITGATSGIGKALAFLLAARGATIILACRDVTKATIVKTEIIEQYPVLVFVKELDLNSFSSIVKFAHNINDEFKYVYALVNNAGVFYHPQQLTEDHFDVTFQTNYLGPFVLTHCLLKSLTRSPNSRIVNVVSEAHRILQIERLINITTSQTLFRPHITAYAASKLALVLFTRHLAEKLTSTKIFVNAVNPGNCETDIFRHFPALSNKWLFALQWIIRVIVVKRPSEGAQTVLHAILTEDPCTGQYLTDCKVEVPSKLAANDTIATQYYNLTRNILKENVNLNCRL